MKTKTEAKFTIKKGAFSFTFLSSGDLYKAVHEKTMINQMLCNPLDGSMNNIYLRVFESGGIKVFPLLGKKSDSKVTRSESHVFFEGSADQITYKVVFTLLEEGKWFWDVSLSGEDQLADLVYGFDMGLADEGAVRTNEAFLSQYIDHSVHEGTRGFTVCSRQNQPQDGGRFPYLQQGALTDVHGYSTDGFQFFGLSYKETDMPEALLHESLANEIYQYEFAYTALQSEKISLSGTSRTIFYGAFLQDCPHAAASPQFEGELEEAWMAAESMGHETAHTETRPEWLAGKPLVSEPLSQAELMNYFPDRLQEETDGGKLLSFFLPEHEHVVLMEKERITERPHGHIVMSGADLLLKKPVLTSTSYMYGIFNSQLTVGNTSFNKMMTNARNALNVPKTSGQRIYIRLNGEYRLLTMPAAFEMGFNYAKWYYKIEDDLLVFTNFTSSDTTELSLQFHSENGRAYQFLIANQLSMNNNEYQVPFHTVLNGKTLSFFADAQSDSAEVYPSLCYRMRISGTEFALRQEDVLASGIPSHSSSIVFLECTSATEWNLTVQGLLHGEDLPFKDLSAEKEIGNYRTLLAETMKNFHLSIEGKEKNRVQKMNSLAWWYTHNMLVHYSVPHGLEQYGGAAWGTRDVSQGPAEYFLATQNYEAVKMILKTIYSHQYEREGNWPQWFMFDDYSSIQQEESHGDVIVWPLKVLSDYLNATNDLDFLLESVPYTTEGTGLFTENQAPLIDHVQKQIGYMKAHFLHDTYLSSYGDGDWDDTLQPANSQLKTYMVSSWTVALTHQVLREFSAAIDAFDAERSADLKALSSAIREDFKQYMLQSDVIPGFLYLEHPGHPEPMLHPEDKKTGIQYRLLPMTRSIISELLTKDEAETQYALIKKHLYFPDGVRLMNRPAQYKGGISTHFKRAEQAANFGREVGLQYVHAHIRFAEAMAKLGKTDEVWNGLERINPITIQEAVPHAERRQSNAYFSSSDGKFNTRYEAQEQFSRLKDGSVPVKGGWRIYSSGPGIYLNQLISNCLGIRSTGGALIIDPVISSDFDGLTFLFEYNGHSIQYIYRVKGMTVSHVSINGKRVIGSQLANPYRSSGIKLENGLVEEHLTAGVNIIDIHMI